MTRWSPFLISSGITRPSPCAYFFARRRRSHVLFLSPTPTFAPIYLPNSRARSYHVLSLRLVFPLRGLKDSPPSRLVFAFTRGGLRLSLPVRPPHKDLLLVSPRPLVTLHADPVDPPLPCTARLGRFTPQDSLRGQK